MRLWHSLAILTPLLAAACGNATTSNAAPDATSDTPDATTGDTAASEPGLQCPHPATLPFTLQSSGWQQKSTEALAQSLPRDKDEAHDLLGVPGGVWFATDLPPDASASTGAQVLHGRKARTETNAGLDTTGLPGEWVSLWRATPGPGQAAIWTQAGRMQTDKEGLYAIELPPALAFAPGQHAAYGILEAEGSCAVHLGLVRPQGTPFMVTDIDGTLTTADSEFTQELVDPTHDPAQKQGAQAMVAAWAQKGYAIVYLTARGHRMRADTRPWLEQHAYPAGVVLTADDLVFGETARKHKALWLQRLTQVLGWKVAAAYGNADSDVHAYADAAVDKKHTFIIGPLAGTEGTTPIPDDDYTAHTASFVAAQPPSP